MDRTNLHPLLAAVLFAVASATGLGAESAADRVAFFESKVRPVLVERCVGCQGPEKQKAGLRLDSLVALLRGGESGAAIDLDDADASNLVAAIRHESWEMPPDGKLPDDQIEAIVSWVKDGAAWTGSKPATELLAAGLPEMDDAEAAATGPKKRSKKGGITTEDHGYWAFRPVVRPAPPLLPSGDTLPAGLVGPVVHNPIDHFILAKLSEAGLEPVPEADRRALIRRLSFDLLGMPPTAADVESFVNDPSPDAYERLVDQLLGDPRYGERMARHWLDLSRYAESDGFRQDAFRPTAWRYRDYIVRAFNADMPYDQFIREQLAGDEISPDEPDAVAATGFLRQTPYEYNISDIDRSWTEVLNEVTDVTGDVFLAMGVGCARCHDHKFDPILQRDYYQLQSFFAALRWRDDVPLVAAGAVGLVPFTFHWWWPPGPTCTSQSNCSKF
jgi:hypothetical protein